MEYVLFFLIILIGSVIQGATGFGFGIFVMAVLPFFFPFKTCSAIVLLLGTMLNVQLAWGLRKNINFKVLLPVLAAALAGRYFGVYALMNLNDTVLKMIFGGVLILLSLFFAFKGNQVVIKPHYSSGMIAGFFSGIMGGMFNTSGPPLVIYYFSVIKDKLIYSGTLQATFFFSALFSVVLHISYGNMNLNVLKFAGIGALAVVTGSMLGLHILKRLDRALLSKIIYSFMAVMGMVMLVNR
jgi:uncharacterized membrane protein YfcA